MSDAMSLPETSIRVIDRGGTSAALSVGELKEHLEKVMEFMANVLEDGKDYGKIPGTDKPTLYKPGAEKLIRGFNMSAVDPTIEDLSTSDEIRYRVRVPIENSYGRVIAVGLGEASTNEEKYRWKRPVCDEEWQETPDHLRREKWFKKHGGDTLKGKQIRTSPADLANTALKMAHKRALVHATLLATAASSVFNQDLEDFTEDLRESMVDVGSGQTAAAAAQKPVQRASEKSGTNGSAAGGPSAPAADEKVKVTGPVPITDVKAAKTKAQKVFYVVVAAGKEYTTWDKPIADELAKFKGTDHKVRLAYEENAWGGKTYLNLKSWQLAEVNETVTAPDGPPPPPEPASTTPVSQSDIPWGR